MAIKKIINTIMEGDSIEQLKKIQDESIDLIFADPPYFMQTDGVLLRTNGTKFIGVEDHWDKFENFKEYDNFTSSWLSECKRILKKDGSIWVIGSFQNIYRIGYIMQNLGFWILNDVIWNKTNPVPNFAGTRFCNAHETLLWCSKSKEAKFTFNYKTMKYLNNDKQERSVWKMPLCTGSERIKNEDGEKAHSTQKPEKLLEKIIISSSKPNDIVLDPFFGTGTTGAMAKKLGRKFIGIEREKEYIKIAKKRIDDVNIKIDKISNLSLEIKPPKVPMEKLVKENYLEEKQKLYNKKNEYVCHVLKNGKVSDGYDILSIHKMSAKVLGKVNNNGWDYFYTYENQEFIPLDKLRYRYAEEKINE